VSDQIPRTLRILWGEQPRRGPRPAISLDRIFEAGIAIAVADGIAALSMARLAERLGSAPMSLYRHVSNKDELLTFMMDAAPGDPPALPAGWRAGLETWGRALRDVYLAHPWILQVTAGRPPLDPGQLAWLDRGLSALDDTGLDYGNRFEAVMTVLNYVRGEAQIIAVLLTDDAADPNEYGRLLAKFVRPDRFPALAAASDAGIFRADGDTDFDSSFRFGLTRILDGLDHFLSTNH
jgi:AcrR family transcriptional regulator